MSGKRKMLVHILWNDLPFKGHCSFSDPYRSTSLVRGKPFSLKSVYHIVVPLCTAYYVLQALSKQLTLHGKDTFMADRCDYAVFM